MIIFRQLNFDKNIHELAAIKEFESLTNFSLNFKGIGPMEEIHRNEVLSVLGANIKKFRSLTDFSLNLGCLNIIIFIQTRKKLLPINPAFEEPFVWFQIFKLS
jgi:hypothetical protein